MLANNGQHIGQIGKLHGVHGQLILVSEDKLQKSFTKTEWVFIKLDGLPVPFRILDINIRTDNSAIITLDGYNTPEASRELIGYDVFILPDKNTKTKKAPKLASSIIGYRIIDQNKGFIGEAKEVIDYDGNVVLQAWHNNHEILIPVDESIIIEIEDKKKEIYTNIPEGLLDLYL
jgi:16S rRNA processing protein RimM